MKSNRNEELKSRRDFFKKAVKSALPILGAISMSFLPIKLKASEVSQYWNCSGCYTTCAYTCRGTCHTTCYTTCVRGCAYTCQGVCGGCKSDCTHVCAACYGSCFKHCTNGTQFG